MIKWPWSKKKDPPSICHSVRPNDELLFKLATGNLDLFGYVLCYQHVNWAYEYLGSSSKVWPYDPVLNKHIVVLTGAAAQYFDDLGVPCE